MKIARIVPRYDVPQAPGDYLVDFWYGDQRITTTAGGARVLWFLVTGELLRP